MIIDSQKDLAEKFKFVQYLYQATNMEPYCDYPPHQVYVEVTNACNFRCETCIQEDRTVKKGFMELDLFKKIVDEVSIFDPYFDFARQGESLTHPKILEMIEYAVKKGLTHTRLITNAALLNKKKAERLIKSGLNKITLSFNGYDRESYERIQKGAKFNVYFKNLFDFLKLKFELGSSTPEVEISTVLFKDIADNLDKFFDLFKALPVDRIRVNDLINFFGSNDANGLNENLKKDFKDWPTCKAPFRTFNINYDGEVVACLADFDSIYTVGNIKKNKILEIWNSERMHIFRNCHINKKINEIRPIQNKDRPFCDNCNQLWYDPNARIQYPASFEKGVRDMFIKERSTGKNLVTMSGIYDADKFRTPQQVQELSQRFLRESDFMYEATIKQ